MKNPYLVVVAIVIVVLIIAGAVYFGLIQKPAPVTQNPQPQPQQPAEKDDLIKVASPLPLQKVSSPLTITGQARGNWYFEASFPVKLLDANNNILAQAPAQAQGDWMTTDYVPFSVTLTFAQPQTATGWLVLEKDNPSGLPQNANELKIPITF